ncbi:MAG: DUF4864 domain-containing protein [Planctomycetota bacterium]
MRSSPTQSARLLRSLGTIGLVLSAAPSNAEDVSTTGSTPRGVVEAQMQALSEWNNDPDAAARVFDLASPANRAVTGPLDRFRQMVEREPFRQLIDSGGWTIGSATKKAGAAVVLVTLIDENNTLRAFRFYLSQVPGEGSDEWRTDGVIPLPVAPAAAEADTPKNEAAI